MFDAVDAPFVPYCSFCSLFVVFVFQLELDTEALERMDELTLEARKEQAETEREKERLQVRTKRIPCGARRSDWLIL